MTFIELTIVVSLISLLSLAIFNALSNGIKIWNKSNQLVLEEDVSIFFDKLTSDLHNAIIFSKLDFDGGETRFTFPAIIKVLPDPNSGLPADEYVDQIGLVQYYFDVTNRAVYRRQANYGQALKKEFNEPQKLVSSVEKFRFKYVYLTDNEEIISNNVLEILPSGLEVEVTFLDQKQEKTMTKIIDILIGS